MRLKDDPTRREEYLKIRQKESRNYYLRNREKLKAKVRARYFANRDAILERYRERHRLVSKEWIRKNPEKMKSYVRNWQRSHPEKMSELCRAYQARKVKAMPIWVKHSDILPFYKQARQATIRTGIAHEVDHVYPLRHKNFSGLHVSWNLRVVPISVNRAKRNTVPSEMLSRSFV